MFPRTLSVLCAALLLPVFSAAADRTHARSMVIHKGGIVATSHHLASSAGAQILARGGSAADAAIAANAVLGVTEPMMCGIGGDVFVLYWEAKTGKLWGLNGSGWSPLALTPEFLESARKDESEEDRKKMPGRGIHSATVPGAVGGWQAVHQRFGKLPWEDLFQAAIHHADEGFPVTEIIAASWEGDILDIDPASTKIFRPGGKAPRVGQVFRNPDLARAMRLIAGQGADAFYRGAIADAILATSTRLGGALTAEDLAEWRPEWVEPIRTEYRDWSIFEIPPNGQGLAALIMLNLMEETDPSPLGPHSAPELHNKMEAMKLAYADIYAYVADPAFEDLPVAQLLSKSYAKMRAQLIEPDNANCDVEAGEPETKDTTYLCKTAAADSGSIQNTPIASSLVSGHSIRSFRASCARGIERSASAS
jgi:gamma-glutamyltranspeptidase/glutathione hydrolase